MRKMADILFQADNSVFSVRTAGVLVKDGKLLVQRAWNGKEYAPPGGHVQLGETTAEGLIREYKEETGADIRPMRLLWTEECFWEWKGKKAHSLAYYYLIHLCDGANIPDKGAFVSHKDNANVVIGWAALDKLEDMTIYPDFLKKKIFELDGPPEHFITRV